MDTEYDTQYPFLSSIQGLVMAKLAQKKEKKVSKRSGDFTPNYSTILDGIERKFKLSNAVMDKRARRSSSFGTGVLTTDLIMGNGGIVPGSWVTFYGPEQSAKSTCAMTTVVSAAEGLSSGMTLYFDYEGCLAEDTQILTPDGRKKPLKHYIEKYSNNPLVEAMISGIDRKNLGKDGADCLGISVPISGVEKIASVGGFSFATHLHYGGIRSTKIIGFDNGNVVRCAQHKFYAFDPISKRWVFQSSDVLKVGDLVLKPAVESETYDNLILKHMFGWEDPKIQSKWGYTKIVSIENGPRERVWDLTLSKYKGTLFHSHVTGGVVTHNSSDPNYIEKFYGNKLSAQEIFGVRNPKTGDWELNPRVRYYTEDVGETFFDAMKGFLNSLPNKVYLKDQWYFEYENTHPNRKIVGDLYDKKLFSKFNKFMVPTSNTQMQALIVLDSYPAMLSDRADERDEGGGGVGEQARMFSENIKKIKPKLKKKGVALIGVNQLRQRPMVQHGPSEYEPGGEALRFFSDQRFRVSPVSLSTIGWGSGGQILEEKSTLQKGYDKYRFIKIKATKNKLAPPYHEGLIRLWVSDSDGEAHGIDPVFDTFQAGKMMGQITGNFKKMTVTLIHDSKAKKTELLAKNISWLDFKAWILASPKDRQVILKKLKKAGVYKGKNLKLNLRKTFATQIKSGLGETLMYAAFKNRVDKEDPDE